jgi:hypothetical protein
MSKLIDLIGKRFGNWVVVSLVQPYIHHTYWTCKCDCGTIKNVSAVSLKRGFSISCGCSLRQNVNRSAFLRLFRTYHSNARLRGVQFKLSKSQTKRITSQNCYYCDAKPNNVSTTSRSNGQKTIGKYIYNGIDRINSDKHYTLNNVVPCCKRCNFAKSDMSQQDFYDWISKTYNHLKSKGIIK